MIALEREPAVQHGSGRRGGDRGRRRRRRAGADRPLEFAHVRVRHFVAEQRLVRLHHAHVLAEFERLQEIAAERAAGQRGDLRFAVLHPFGADDVAVGVEPQRLPDVEAFDGVAAGGVFAGEVRRARAHGVVERRLAVVDDRRDRRARRRFQGDRVAHLRYLGQPRAAFADGLVYGRAAAHDREHDLGVARRARARRCDRFVFGEGRLPLHDLQFIARVPRARARTGRARRRAPRRRAARATKRPARASARALHPARCWTCRSSSEQPIKARTGTAATAHWPIIVGSAAAEKGRLSGPPAGHRRQDHERVALADGGVEAVEHAHVLVVEVHVDVAVELALGGEQLALRGGVAA